MICLVQTQEPPQGFSVILAKQLNRKGLEEKGGAGLESRGYNLLLM